MNNNKLKSSKFIKLLKDSNILIKGVLATDGLSTFRGENDNLERREGITQIEADLIFKKLTSG